MCTSFPRPTSNKVFHGRHQEGFTTSRRNDDRKTIHKRQGGTFANRREPVPPAEAAGPIRHARQPSEAETRARGSLAASNNAKPLFEDTTGIKTDPEMVQLAVQLIDRTAATIRPTWRIVTRPGCG